jgi:hypothetical protein
MYNILDIFIEKSSILVCFFNFFCQNPKKFLNSGSFPGDFMFQLTKEEWDDLTFQNGISNKQHGGRRFMPYAHVCAAQALYTYQTRHQ